MSKLKNESMLKNLRDMFLMAEMKMNAYYYLRHSKAIPDELVQDMLNKEREIDCYNSEATTKGKGLICNGSNPNSWSVSITSIDNEQGKAITYGYDKGVLYYEERRC